MLTVKFTGIDGRGNPVAKGSVSLVGGKAVPKFANPDLARNIMAELVGNLTSKDSPEAWMRVLWIKYKSPYLTASKAVAT